MHRRTRQRTPKIERVMSAIKVMDPTHPLFGKTLRLLSEHCGRGPAFVSVGLQDGRRRLVLRSATDLESRPTRVGQISRISARSLLPLARHIQCYWTGLKVDEEALHASRSRCGSDLPQTSKVSTQQSANPASAGSAITRSPQPARSAERKDPGAYSRRGSRWC